MSSKTVFQTYASGGAPNDFAPPVSSSPTDLCRALHDFQNDLQDFLAALDDLDDAYADYESYIARVYSDIPDPTLSWSCVVKIFFSLVVQTAIFALLLFLAIAGIRYLYRRLRSYFFGPTPVSDDVNNANEMQEKRGVA